MPHSIRLTSAAAKALDGCPRKLRERLADKINQLAVNPRPADARLLKGGHDLFRVRVGDYRIVYEFDTATGVVGIIRLGHRSEIYRRLA